MEPDRLNTTPENPQVHPHATLTLGNPSTSQHTLRFIYIFFLLPEENCLQMTPVGDVIQATAACWHPGG